MLVANLNLYATRLYELLVYWRSTGKTPFIKINNFRSKGGLVGNEYKAMCDFKKRVLDPEKFKELYPYLEKIRFQSSNVKYRTEPTLSI